MMTNENSRLTEAKPSAQRQVRFSNHPRISAAIIRMALWGVLPVVLADWLAHRGGRGHE